MSAKRAEVIDPGNALHRKVGGGSPVGLSAIAAAEAAVQAFASNTDWLADELEKLEASRAAIRQQGLTGGTVEALYRRAHELKGLGSTFNFPLVTRVAASLCRLIANPEQPKAPPLPLVDAHIDAIKALLRDQIRDDAHPVGTALTTALEQRVHEHYAA